MDQVAQSFEERSFFVRKRDWNRTVEAGFGKVAHVPFIVDRRLCYHRLANQYLIDRALQTWSPRKSAGSLQRSLSDVSLLDIGKWLANFLEWAERRSIDLNTCEYNTHLIDRYQSEMLSGTWSLFGKPLRSGTINLRVQAACDFLSWMGDRGHRGQFTIDNTLKPVNSGISPDGFSLRRYLTEARSQKLTQRASELPPMPGARSVFEWLKDVRERAGEVRGLMCEVVVSTAIRREELVCLRVDSIPDPITSKHIRNPELPASQQTVLMVVQFGTKGKKWGRDERTGDKIGPRAEISIPLFLAEEINRYKRTIRGKAVERWISSGITLAERRTRSQNLPTHLFLDEESGIRIDARDIYRAWTGAKLPIEGWNLRWGRHYWACATLIREARRESEFRSNVVSSRSAYSEDTIKRIIQLVIQPQLRHAHPETSHKYLRWYKARYTPGFNIAYEVELEENYSSKRVRTKTP